MDARVKLLGHPVHQMLIVFPLGLLAMGVIFDLVYFGADSAVFAVVAYWILMRGGAVESPPNGAYVCSFLGAGLALFTAWLGGELVDRLGIGVHEGANVDAPSSLRVRDVPAHRTP
jgi:uncharacterized membrane protein